MSILDRRVVLVTGKGGVGKTTVSALVALRAARAGKRVLLCETSGSTQVPNLFRARGRGYEAVEVAPRLWT
ncbi:MAG: ArsA-related P-loop ATPase, partial [bacterium]